MSIWTKQKCKCCSGYVLIRDGKIEDPCDCAYQLCETGSCYNAATHVIEPDFEDAEPLTLEEIAAVEARSHV